MAPRGIAHPSPVGLGCYPIECSNGSHDTSRCHMPYHRFLQDTGEEVEGRPPGWRILFGARTTLHVDGQPNCRCSTHHVCLVTPSRPQKVCKQKIYMMPIRFPLCIPVRHRWTTVGCLREQDFTLR